MYKKGGGTLDREINGAGGKKGKCQPQNRGGGRFAGVKKITCERRTRHLQIAPRDWAQTSSSQKKSNNVRRITVEKFLYARGRSVDPERSLAARKKDSTSSSSTGYTSSGETPRKAVPTTKAKEKKLEKGVAVRQQASSKGSLTEQKKGQDC